MGMYTIEEWPDSPLLQCLRFAWKSRLRSVRVQRVGGDEGRGGGVVAVLERAGGQSGWLRAGQTGDLLQSSPRAAQFSHILSFEIKGSDSKGAVLGFTIAFYKVPQIFRTKFRRFWKLPPKEVPLIVNVVIVNQNIRNINTMQEDIKRKIQTSML